MREDAIYHLTYRLKSRVERVTEETLVKDTKTVDNDHMNVIKGNFRQATGEKVTTMLGYYGVCKAVETAFIKVVASGPIVQATTKMIVRKRKLMAQWPKL